MRRFPLIVGDRDPIMRAGRTTVVWVLVGLTLGLALGVLRYATLTTAYSSTVTLELSAVAPLVDLNPAGARVDELTMDTDALVVESDAVVAAVTEVLGDTPAEVRDSLSVSARPLTRILEISYQTTTSPDASREGAAAAAEAYLDLREVLIIEPVREYLEGIARATDDLEGAISTGNVTRGDTALEARRRQAEAYRVGLSGPGSVLQSATTPVASRGDLPVVLVSYAAVGGLLGLMVGLFLERRARRPKDYERPVPAAAPVAREMSLR